MMNYLKYTVPLAVAMALSGLATTTNAGVIVGGKDGYETNGATAIAEVIVAIAFERETCSQDLSYFDLDAWLKARGYRLADFTPNRKYWKETERTFKTLQQFMALVGKGRACLNVLVNLTNDSTFAAALLKHENEKKATDFDRDHDHDRAHFDGDRSNSK